MNYQSLPLPCFPRPRLPRRRLPWLAALSATLALFLLMTFLLPRPAQAWPDDMSLAWSSSTVGENRAVAWGDYDGDGDADLAVANDDAPIQVYRNDHGVLVQVWSSPETAFYTDVSFGDVDADGDLDLAVASTDQPIRIYKYQNGTFTLWWNNPWGTINAQSVAFGNWNGDGYADLAAANRGGSIDIYIFNAGGFSTTQTCPGSSSWNSLAWYGGGAIVAGNYNASPRFRVYYYRNNWCETFMSSPTDPGVEDPVPITGIAVGEMDHSPSSWGYLDVVIAIESAPPIIYRRRQFDFQQSTWLITNNYGNSSVATADYDGDGDSDVVVGFDYSYVNVEIFRNDTTTFDYYNPYLPFSLAWSSPEQDMTTGLAWADYDGDTDPDLAVATRGQTRVYLNGGGVARPAWSSAEVDTAFAVAWGDYDNDGDLDLATGNKNQPVRIYRNDLRDELTLAWSSNEAGDIREVAWGDYDADGDLDLAVANFGGNNRVYRNDGGTMTLAWTAPVAESSHSVAWGDYDADGDLDLAVGNEGQPVRLYENEGGTLTSVWTAPAGESTHSVAWGNYNGDNYPDLAVGNFYNNNRVYTSTGMSLTLAWTAPDSVATLDIAWGDWDGDGDDDLFTGDQYYGAVVWENNAGSLSYAWSAPEGYQWTQHIDVADWDGDGDLDLALGNLLRPVMIYRNSTTENPAVADSARLTYAWTAPKVDETYSVDWGDWDGDGDLDLAVGNSGPVQVYENDTSNMAIAQSIRDGYLSAMAWGDIDGDGDLDLATSGFDSYPPCRVYRNDGGRLTPSWSGPAGPASSMAWADWDSDGDLDLAIGGATLMVYRNTGGTLSGPVWQISGYNTTDMEWADYDGDGDLDLATGSSTTDQRIYRNMTAETPGVPDSDRLVVAWSSPQTTNSVAWGDYDGDSDPDLAIAGWQSPSRLYRNDGGAWTLVWTAPYSDSTYALAWGDLDGDGRLDLAAGNKAEQPNRVYRNEGGTLVEGWTSPQTDDTRDLAWADYDGDGDLDLAVANYQLGPMWQPNRIYRNDGGTLTLDWSTSENLMSTQLAWADYDVDGDPDMAVFSDPFMIIYRSRSADMQRLLGLTTARISYPGGAAGQGHAMARILSGPILPVTYKLYDSQSDSALFVRAYYSYDGGSTWREAVAATGTITTNLPASSSGETHVYNWDVYNSGFFGLSDDVIFRLDVYQGFSQNGPYQYAMRSARTTPFRLRGNQVRVLQGANPASGATVYRLPAGQEGLFEPYRDDTGQPFHTDTSGYLLGRGVIGLGDRLVGLLPITATDSYTLCYSSAAPSLTGVDAYTVTTLGVQTLIVSPDNPLVLLNLAVSLQWDARQDNQFLEQLAFDLQRTSALLYDWSNGQVALGDVAVYHDRERWDDADIRIYATNRMRPNAAQGGIVPSVLTDTQYLTITYAPGMVHMGATWNRYGDPGGSLNEDWPRTLAHELGHYAFFLDDNYLGFDTQGRLIPVDGCPGVMTDPYREDWPYDELHPESGWLPECADTLSQRVFGRSDWATVELFYPALSGAQDNAGPSSLPLAVTELAFVEPAIPPTTLEDPTFYLVNEGGGMLQPGNSARAMLFQGDILIDLGAPTLDRVLARGARLGGRLCVFEPEAGRLGCETIAANDNQLMLRPVTDWQPEILLAPQNVRTMVVTITDVPAGLELAARLYPLNGNRLEAKTLAWDGSGYTGVLTATDPFPAGYVHVWVEEPEPRREALTNYALGSNPGRMSGLMGAPSRGRSSPAVSADGQAILFGNLEFSQDEFYALQALNRVPDPLPWTTPVGHAYRLLASPGAPNLSAASLSLAYMAGDVVPGEEGWIRMYYWDGTAWNLLPTTLDPVENMAAAPCQGEGIYALMSSIEVPLEPGWNLLAYPIAETRPITNALLSIQDAYTIVYGYDTTQPFNPWSVYGPGAPGWVNDLDTFVFGRGYWISATGAITLYLKGTEGKGLASGVPNPPATYYGQVLSSDYFTPAPGMPVTAWVDGHLCGSSSTMDVDGQVVYVTSVRADDEVAGCGAPGRDIVFQVGTQPMHLVAWDNGRLWQLNLRPNTAPLPADDSAITEEDSAVLVPVLDNDTDPDGDALVLAAVGRPIHGTAAISGNVVLYMPSLHYTGADTFFYTAGDGVLTGTASVAISVTVVNYAPTPADDNATTAEDTAVLVPVLANDTDPDDDTLGLVAVGAPAHGTAAVSGDEVLYTPALNYNGLDTFSYTAGDGRVTATANVTVTITPVNDAPTAMADAIAADEDTTLTIPVLDNDADVDGDRIALVAVSAPAHGTATLDSGLVTYTPTVDYNGPDTFAYTISDSRLTATATVAITVTPVNDPPAATPDVATTNEDAPVEIAVLHNDTDIDGDSLSLGAIGVPAHGTAAINGSTVLYTPTLNYYGSDTFTYTNSDGHGGTAGALVTVTVLPVNDPPVAVSDTAVISANIAVVIPVLVNDTDPDGDTLTITALGSPAHGTAALSGTTAVVYTPTLGYDGEDTFLYIISDGHGRVAYATVTVTVTGPREYRIYLPAILKAD